MFEDLSIAVRMDLIDDLTVRFDEMVNYRDVYRVGSEVSPDSFSKYQYTIAQELTPHGIWGEGEYRYSLTQVIHRAGISSIEVNQLVVGVNEAGLRNYLESMRPRAITPPPTEDYGDW